MDNTKTDLPTSWQNHSSETLHEDDIQVRKQSSGAKKGSVDETTLYDGPTPQEKPSESHIEAETQRTPSKQIVRLTLSDPEHPNNWSKPKKAFILAGGITTVIHSTLGSSLPSNAIEYIARDFGVTNQIQLVLPISCFLMGYVFAPIICGPLSENFGRRPVMLTSFLTYTIFTMCCAVAPTWASFLFFRFLCGLTASAPIACVGGIFADINADPRKRGQAMAMFMAATACGPVVAPPLSGFIAENVSWRWVFGVAAIFAACTIPFISLQPETYAPILMSQKAARMRKETGNENIIAQSDLQKRSFKYVITVVMTRPIRMLFQELIVSTTCTFLSLVYGIFYLYFEAYPIIFQGPDSFYKFSSGIAGLTFLPIMIGAIIALGIFFAWDGYVARAQEHKAAWAQMEEYRRLPLALLGGPMYAVAILWLGWSARPDVFWLAPVASGVAFGCGFILIFMAMLTYLSDAYMTFSASAQGIASSSRSLLGVLLPLSAHTMFTNLGVDWACTILALLSLLLSLVPLLFMKYGEKIKAGSKFCQELHALHQKELEEKERDEREGRSEKV